MNLNTTVILIGPICAGKSTIARLLAEKLGCERYELDELRWDYYQEMDGYDKAQIARIANSDEGMVGVLRYHKPFEAAAVESVMADYSGCVIDFGAGHSVYEDEVLLARVEKALAPHPYVILVLPSPDLDRSVAVLNDRFTQLLQKEVGHVDEALLQVNEQFVRHPSNHRLAKMVIYTDGKTAEESCVEILARMGMD